MSHVPKILHENGIDTEDRVFVALRLHHIAHGQRAYIRAVFEVPRIWRVFRTFLKPFARVSPFGKHRRGSHCDRAGDLSSFEYSFVPRMIVF